jgi:molecular chaperone DnaK (HSP70)
LTEHDNLLRHVHVQQGEQTILKEKTTDAVELLRLKNEKMRELEKRIEKLKRKLQQQSSSQLTSTVISSTDVQTKEIAELYHQHLEEKLQMWKHELSELLGRGTETAAMPAPASTSVNFSECIYLEMKAAFQEQWHFLSRQLAEFKQMMLENEQLLNATICRELEEQISKSPAIKDMLQNMKRSVTDNSAQRTEESGLHNAFVLNFLHEYD